MDPAIIAALAGVLTAVGAFIVFWMMIGKRLATGEAAYDAAISAEKKADVLGQQLNDHRVKTASDVSELRTIASETAKTLTSAEMRLVKSIDDLGARFDHFTDRLDSVLTSILKQSSQPSPNRRPK